MNETLNRPLSLFHLSAYSLALAPASCRTRNFSPAIVQERSRVAKASHSGHVATNFGSFHKMWSFQTRLSIPSRSHPLGRCGRSAQFLLWAWTHHLSWSQGFHSSWKDRHSRLLENTRFQVCKSMTWIRQKAWAESSKQRTAHTECLLCLVYQNGGRHRNTFSQRKMHKEQAASKQASHNTSSPSCRPISPHHCH